MRVLVNCDVLAPAGGVELSTLQVSGELARRGHDCHLLYAADGNLGPQWRAFSASDRQVPGFTVELRRPWRTIHHLPAAISAGTRVRPDVIYLNRAEQLLWGTLTSARSGAPLVCHLRHHPFSAPVVRVMSRRVHHFLAVSAAIKDEWVAAGVSAAAVTVVPNGVDTDRYRPADAVARAKARADLGLPDQAFVVLHYGRLTAEKGLQTLSAAWAQWPAPAADQAAVDRVLVLAGDLDASAVEALAGISGPISGPNIAPISRTSSTTDTGPARAAVVVLPRTDDVTTLLAAADLVVVPSHWAEPFGRVVIEAMSAGVPVIASRVGGIPEILTGRFDAQLVPPADSSALASKLAEMATWRTTQPDLGDAGRLHVQRNFSLSRTVDEVESALQAAVSSAHIGPRSDRLNPQHSVVTSGGAR